MRRVYWLEHGDVDEVVEVPEPRDQLMLAAAATAVGVRHAVPMDLALTQAHRLTQAVPVKRLRVRKGPDFWETVAADVAGDHPARAMLG